MLVTLGAYEDVTYFLVVLSSLESSPLPIAPGRRFYRLVVFVDKEQITSRDALGSFVSEALRSGARSILTGGSAAERVHDTFDEEIVYAEVIRNAPYCDSERGEFIPTAWFTDDPVDSVLWNATIMGCDAFEPEDTAVVVVLIEGDLRIAEVERIGKMLPGSLDAVVDRD